MMVMDAERVVQAIDAAFEEQVKKLFGFLCDGAVSPRSNPDAQQHFLTGLKTAIDMRNVCVKLAGQAQTP